MAEPINFRAFPVLYVDDERANLVALRYALGDRFTILTALSGEEGLELLRSRPDIAVLLADFKMPGMTGTELCEQAIAIRPDVIRMILTAYADLHAASEAINRGQVQKF